MARVSSGRRVAVIVCALSVGVGLVSLGAQYTQPGGWGEWPRRPEPPGPTPKEVSAGRFYAEAVDRLPAGAFDVRCKSRTHAYGWLTFSLTEDGKTSRYLAYYRSGDGGGIQFAITRAD